MTTASDRIPHNDFAEGFKVGFQAVQGTANTIPGIPEEPDAPSNLTPFLMGVRLGIQAAMGTLTTQTSAGSGTA